MIIKIKVVWLQKREWRFCMGSLEPMLWKETCWWRKIRKPPLSILDWLGGWNIISCLNSRYLLLHDGVHDQRANTSCVWTAGCLQQVSFRQLAMARYRRWKMQQQLPFKREAFRWMVPCGRQQKLLQNWANISIVSRHKCWIYIMHLAGSCAPSLCCQCWGLTACTSSALQSAFAGSARISGDCCNF